MVFGQGLIVAHAATVLADPGEGALDDPASGQDLEPGQVIGALDDLHGQAEQLGCPANEPACVATVGPDVGNGVASGVQGGEQAVGAVAVLDPGRGDHDREQQSAGVDGDVALAGDNYTRAAARAGTEATDAAGRTDRRGDCLVREHVRRVLQAHRNDDDARARRVGELERDGYRIVEGCQTDGDQWVIHDWRTGELLASGGGGIDGYDAACERLDPAQNWYDSDALYDDVPLSDVATPGVPATLANLLEEWVATTATPDAEIAEFVGWLVSTVTAHRQEF